MTDRVLAENPVRSGGTHAPASPLGLPESKQVCERISAALAGIIEGKPEVIRTTLVVLLAEGHLLVEDVPGVGKTMLAKALAQSIDGSVNRIQFTPDLVPSDITGVDVVNPQTHDFQFRPGAVFAHLVVGDEINRASPKTQSALLEAMEERQVTVGGTTYALPDPFMVVATQNPIEMQGTYALPEAQRDRFLARITMGYPSVASEVAMLEHHAGDSPLDQTRPVTDVATIRRVLRAARGIYVADAIRQYVVDLASATRAHPELRLGASPRASLHLIRAARGQALLDGRDHVLPDDVQALAEAIWAHRLVTTTDARIARHTAADVLAEIVATIRVPGRSR